MCIFLYIGDLILRGSEFYIMKDKNYSDVSFKRTLLLNGSVAYTIQTVDHANITILREDEEVFIRQWGADIVIMNNETDIEVLARGEVIFSTMIL